MNCPIATYQRRLDADEAVGVLKHAGIDAHWANGAAGHDVYVHEPHSVPMARHLLESATNDVSAGVRPADGPDLKRLKLTCAPHCPACGKGLPLESELRRCPHCGGPVDVVEMLRARYGPDFMGVCDAFNLGPVLGPEVVHQVCPCGYTLIGLGWSGNCPECGRAFQK